MDRASRSRLVVAAEAGVDAQIVVVLAIEQIVDTGVGLDAQTAQRQARGDTQVAQRHAVCALGVGIVRLVVIVGDHVDTRTPDSVRPGQFGEALMTRQAGHGVAGVVDTVLRVFVEAVARPGIGETELPGARQAPVQRGLDAIATRTTGVAVVGTSGLALDFVGQQFVVEFDVVQRQLVTECAAAALEPEFAIERMRGFEIAIEATAVRVGQFIDRR